ncbi:sensor domain-containing diguanylate cyclase [Cryptosporangium arvum]|uniref:sensor domain-containing diguanylate cyclase n=1 Tax=Cryptosporangium arvum TaxID=80871 RepID=UPI0004AE8E7A|nr:sensor domain-containing diguanylate cyclase [Cryptosporangium arvum]
MGKRGRERWRRSGLLLVGAVLLGGGAVTAAAYDVVNSGEERYSAQVMTRYADELAVAVSDRVVRYGETLHDLAAAVGAQTDLRGDDFARITAGLDNSRLAGAASISFIVPATTAEIPAVQAYWRARGSPDLALNPTPRTAEHAFVVLERIFDNSATIVGVDLAQRPQPTEALRVARANGALAISPAFTLLRDEGIPALSRQPSVAFAVPVYTGLGSTGPHVFEGWIVMPVRGQDFLSSTLLERGQGAVQVTVTEETAQAAVLTTAFPGQLVRDDSLTRSRTVVVGQRRWQLTVRPTARLIAATDRGLSRFTIAAGVALTLMLGVLTGALAGSRGRALQQVDEATAALRLDIARRERVEARLREREQELQRLAFHDPLTGLANRTLFYDRLTHALATHARAERVVALLFVDLDGFKEVNDRLGHQAGDVVLRTVADRLRAGLRAVDTVARFGGDEFAIILEGLSAAPDARRAAERVIADLRAPIDVDGAEARVSASVGIVLSGVGADADELIRGADAAMYTAKNSGKNRYVEAGA